jgi:hypothetical protein
VTRPTACFRAALSFLDRGWASLALCPPGRQGAPEGHARTCRQPGKRPLGRWKAWQGAGCRRWKRSPSGGRPSPGPTSAPCWGP